MQTKRILHVFSVISTPVAFFDGQFRFLTEKGYVIHVVSSPSELGNAFAERNRAYYHPVVINRSISLMADLKAILAIIRIIRENNIDVVVGHTPKGALVAMLASSFAEVRRRVYYRHGLVYTTASGIRRFFLKNEERFVSALATDIVNVSESLSRLAVKDSLNRQEKQTVFRKGTCGGIDARGLFNPEMINPLQVDALKDKNQVYRNSFIFGYAGRLCRDKGIIELYDGFKLFRSRNLSRYSKLLLIGEMDERDKLPSDFVEQMKRDPDVIMTGAREKSEMPLYYSLMDVFVFPSYREGFGMSVIEASAMEKPILVSRSHGCVDSIEEGVTGQYISLNAESICEGMESMLDPQKRKKLGVAGRERVLKDYDYTVMWPLIAEYYETLFNSLR